MRFTVEAWAPDFGASMEAAPEEEPTAPIETAIEVPDAAWAPIHARGEVPEEVAFVDGVNRIDAQVWLLDDDVPKPGLCSTVAAGVVVCNAEARVTDVAVERRLYAGSPSAEAISTSHATYAVAHWAGDVDMLAAAVIDGMRSLEARVARAAPPVPLLVLDGLLWGREDVPNAIGYVKSHRRRYLTDDQERVLHALEPGQRTPMFLLSTQWSRFTWYVRLPGGSGHPLAGLVRCEANNALSVADAARLADASCAALPRFASAAHRDPRAPQNLYPIGGLERQLRRRMGDARLLERSLRVAAG